MFNLIAVAIAMSACVITAKVAINLNKYVHV